MNSNGYRSRIAGFTLLEVLVAFAILALSLGVLLQVFATGLRNTTVAENYSQAAMYAESILAALGAGGPLEEGADGGEINEIFSWRSQVSAYSDDDLELDDLRAKAYQVTVEVFWGEPGRERSVSLDTLRLEPEQRFNNRRALN